MSTGRRPQPISAALSELITLRGWARSGGDSALADAWATVAGDATAGKTRVQGVKRGVLHVDVSNSALLSELVAFHRVDLLEQLQSEYPDLRIRDLKFRLQGRL